LTQILRGKPKTKRPSDDFSRRAAARSVGQIAQFISDGKTKVVTPQIFRPTNPRDRRRVFRTSPTISGFSSAVGVLINACKTPRSPAMPTRSGFRARSNRRRGGNSALRANLNSPDYYLAGISRESLRKYEFISNLERAKFPRIKRNWF
jgi:hypothetical protein